MNEYEQQAQDFLQKYNLTCEIKNIGSIEKWNGVRYAYDVVIFRNSSRSTGLSFKFYGSIADFEKKNRQETPYSILACLSSDSQFTCEQDLIDAYGDDFDSYDNVSEIVRFGKRINRFFTDAELEDLGEIR